MLNITLICVGRLKEPYLQGACDEYCKRLKTLCKCTVVELQPERLSESPSAGEIAAALEKEGKRILEKVPSGAAVIAMCIEGKQLSSQELAQKLAAFAVSGTGSLAFVIGGSFGLSDSVKQKSILRLSVSRMTFPHQLFRVMLLEQIYRALQINAGAKYHK